MDDFDLFKSDAESFGAAVLTQKSLVDTKERLGAMLDVMPIGLLIHTEQGILFSNKAACGLLHAEPARLLGQHVFDYLRSSDVDRVALALQTLFAGMAETCDLEAVVEVAPRSSRLVRVIASRLPWPGTPVIQLLLNDITDQKRAENSLRQLTITDELTGAYNRRHVCYEAALYLNHAQDGIPVSIIMVDIDHFKAVNDTHGHAVGDLALKRLTALANELLPTIEGTDSAIFARLGGEEFVMLLPGLGEAAAMATAELFREGVAAMRIDLADGQLRFTISAGIATYCAADADFDALLDRADQALYRAKRDGRNRVALAMTPVNSSAVSLPPQRARRRAASG